MIGPDFTVYCPGHYEYGGRSFKCSLSGGRGHGLVNLSQAIEKSCNVFFYTVGAKMKIDTIHDYAARLRAGMNDVLAELGVPWAVYGEHTGFHVFTNPRGLPIGPRSFDPLALGYADLKVPRGNLAVTKLCLAMRVHGVDMHAWPGGPVSAVHDGADLERTLAAFRASLSNQVMPQ